MMPMPRTLVVMNGSAGVLHLDPRKALHIAYPNTVVDLHSSPKFSVWMGVKDAPAGVLHLDRGKDLHIAYPNTVVVLHP